MTSYIDTSLGRPADYYSDGAISQTSIADNALIIASLFGGSWLGTTTRPGGAAGGAAARGTANALDDPLAGTMGGHIATNAARGRAFERDAIDGIVSHLGLGHNTRAVTQNGVTTILDVQGRPVGLIEIKDVIDLSNSPQLRAQMAEAIRTGQPYSLVVSPRNQTISGPLQQQIREVNERVGGGIYRYNPQTGTLTPWP